MASPESTPPVTARTLLKASDVCQLVDLRAYVLRSWETEFPSLGVARTPGGPRMYRKRDLERVQLIKQLVFDEGLTLAGVRRRLDEPAADADEAELPDLAEVLGAEAREQVEHVKAGLRSILDLLSVAPAARQGAAGVADDGASTAGRNGHGRRAQKAPRKKAAGKKAAGKKAAGKKSATKAGSAKRRGMPSRTGRTASARQPASG